MHLINNTSSTHHSVLKELLSKADDMLIASPFCYADFTEFADDAVSCGVKRVRFVTTLKDDEVVGKIDALLSFCHEMKRIGVVWKLMIDNRLHGKVMCSEGWQCRGCCHLFCQSDAQRYGTEP